jgi:hypothetical protein
MFSKQATTNWGEGEEDTSLRGQYVTIFGLKMAM